MSFRADSYTFAEENFFDGCSNPWDEDRGDGLGYHKFYNNIEIGTYNDKANTITNVATRTEKVANNCKFIAANIDYSSFDTDPNLFYYANGKSDCKMTDAITARVDCLLYSGVQKRDYSNIDTSFSKYTPTKAVTVTKEWNSISIPTKTGDAEVDGVLFRDTSGSGKGKGQYVTFTLANRTEISVTCADNGDLVRADGLPIATKISTYNGILEAGTYLIRASKYGSGSNVKEVNVSELKFRLGVSDQEVADNVISLINAIPATIDESAGTAITAARAAYDALSAAQKELVTNLSKLTEAETAFANIAVTSINGKITNLAATSTATTEAEMRALLAQYNEVKTLYEAIPADKISQVNNYSKVTDGITALNAGLKPYDVKNQIAALPAKAAVTSADRAAVEAARTAYDALSADQKTIVGDITKLTDAEDALADIAAQTVVAIFARDDKNKPLTNLVPENVVVTGNYKDGETFEYNGETYSDPLKMESSTTVTITLAAQSKLKLKLNTASKKIYINGTAYTSDSNGFIEETFAAGTCTITKGDSINLCYIEITGA